VEPDEGRAVSHEIAALVNLDHPGHYVHFGWVDISIANLIVIVLMVVVFVLALLLPIPHGGRK
jgi:hypothetical protein